VKWLKGARTSEKYIFYYKKCLKSDSSKASEETFIQNSCSWGYVLLKNCRCFCENLKRPSWKIRAVLANIAQQTAVLANIAQQTRGVLSLRKLELFLILRNIFRGVLSPRKCNLLHNVFPRCFFIPGKFDLF